MLAGSWEDTVVDNIDEEYERLIQYLRGSAKKAEGSRTTKRRLSHETLQLMRQKKTSRRDEQQCWLKPQRQGEASGTPAKTSPTVRSR
ncbi:hypothetical protein Y032_0084g1759 [Ancylostoma ceylanicum]|uniref:Uncharacterized protein n=1 Tax=Ancylostoma ceylanicum TaxID=53326 RepID=A0A016TQS8_9BILA|nr:hypothetical protein Y032_0084g1759 [Ancylostoma ceylanicum]